LIILYDTTMKFVSHRGAAGLAHENSIEGYKLAASFKPTYIETDLNRTRDGVFVMYHGKLHQTYIGNGLEETYSELKERIPSIVTLEEFVKIRSSVPFMIDVKIKSNYQEAFELLNKAPESFHSAFTSPHRRPLATAQHMFPKANILISQPYEEGAYRTIQLARKYGFGAVSMNKWWLGPITYYLCNRYDLDIMVYTVDRPFTMWLIQKFFPKVMICTNHPERIPRRLTIPDQIEKPTTSKATNR
jgi:glycerophosphoryl diester phosphodiesterase